MDLEQAAQKHGEWKVKFRAAISKQEAMDAPTIAKDNACELGKWLHGEAMAKFGSIGSFAAVVSKHAAFHVEAGKVAAAINAKKFAEAGALLDSPAYQSASTAVSVAILQLKKDIANKG